MAMDTWAAEVTECPWAPEECPLGQPVSVTSERDSLCAPSLFRSRRVKPFPKIRGGLSSPYRGQSASELFTKCLDRRAIEELCKRVNGSGVEASPPAGSSGEKQRPVQESDFLAWIAVALQGGLAAGDGGGSAAGMVAMAERWQGRFQRSLSTKALLSLYGQEENGEEKWESFYTLQANISRSFQALYTPGRQLCVKKYALSYRGHPNRCHLNVALLCELESGYVCNFFLYIPAVLQRGSKSILTEQVLHRLLKPYYSKGYNVQLDAPAQMEGRLRQVFSGLGVHLQFVSLWAGEGDTVRPYSPPPSPSPSASPSQQQRDSGTLEGSMALLKAHLRGWVGPVILPRPSDTWECQPAVFLQGFWLLVHLGCINAFVLHSLQSRDPGCQTSLYDFTNALATQLAAEYLVSNPPTSGLLSGRPRSPNVPKAAAKKSVEHRSSDASISRVQEGDSSSTGPCVGARPGLCGLVNSGNSCYMNAVLQCLLNTAPLVEHFLDRQNRSKISKLKGATVAGPFLRLVEEAWFGRQDVWNPSEMRAALCTLHPQFNTSCQQDAQELLLFLLNALHDDLVKMEVQRVRRGPLLPRESSKSPSLPDRASVVTRLFEGQLSYITLCMHCNHRIQRNQVFTTLSLPVPAHVMKCSLQDCLALFFEQSTLTHSDRMLCPQCGLRQDATVLTTLVQAPDILILHLKRGKHKRKLKTNVVFPLEDLDLSPFSSSLSPQHGPYSLYGVVDHMGNLDMGHYTACCRNSSACDWHRFDDAAVSEVWPGHVQSPGAYILLYSCEKLHHPGIVTE